MNMEKSPHSIFVTGGTGYIGSRLINILLHRGHTVKALTRIPSIHKLPAGSHPVFGSAVSGEYSSHVPPCNTFIHLVGVSHPSPSKAAEFHSVDLVSLRHAVIAAQAAAVAHFVYISVAQPAPVMKAYIEVRRQCEQIIRESGLNATIVRPWYVLGPGHRWPYALKPMYWLLESIPATRASAQRLGLVTLNQMLNTLVAAAENPATGVRVLGVPEIRRKSAWLNDTPQLASLKSD
jgi:uncharacterized protein YbjT (DUF2867 family)